MTLTLIPDDMLGRIAGGGLDGVPPPEQRPRRPIVPPQRPWPRFPAMPAPDPGPGPIPGPLPVPA